MDHLENYIGLQYHKTLDIAIEVQSKCFSVLVSNISRDLLIFLCILHLSFQIVLIVMPVFRVLCSGLIFFKKVKSLDDYK